MVKWLLVLIVLLMSIGNASALYGDGSDGDVTISVDTTLTSDMNYNSLTINSGVTLYPDGYVIYVLNTLTLNGAIDRSGNDGSIAWWDGTFRRGGAGGAALPTRSVGGSASGGAGGNGGIYENIQGRDANGGPGGNGGNILDGIAKSSGGNGSYAYWETVEPGDGGITTAEHTITSDNVNDIITYASSRLGGPGGGGSAGAASYGAGGGGSGGGVIYISAKTITGNGNIYARGGNGGMPGVYGQSTYQAGGGGGGCIVVEYEDLSDYIGLYVEGGAGTFAGTSGTVYKFTPPTINIDTRITQVDELLTSVVVNDESNTGGFPNENGYRYLTPDEKESKEYTVYLLGDDLAPGFKFLMSASSTDVSKLTIDIEDLASARTYDVYFDDVYVESINGVTTYEYDITSFSLHTLEVRYVASIETYVTNVAGLTYIQDVDSTGGFVDNNGYITLTPEIADSYPLTIENDFSDGVKITFTSSDTINSMPLTFYGFDVSEDYKFYLDGTLISTISPSSIFYYDVITHDEITIIEFVKCSTGGGGGDNGDDDSEEEDDNDTGIIIIDDEIIDIVMEIIESKLDEDLVETLILTEPIKTVTTFIKTPTNWLILIGAYIGILIGTLLTSKVNIPTILLYGTITWITILIITALGLNLFLLNYIFSSTSVLLATLNYTVYGILVSLIIGE